jgi:hypothetical protein
MRQGQAEPSYQDGPRGRRSPRGSGGTPRTGRWCRARAQRTRRRACTCQNRSRWPATCHQSLRPLTRRKMRSLSLVMSLLLPRSGRAAASHARAARRQRTTASLRDAAFVRALTRFSSASSASSSWRVALSSRCSRTHSSCRCATSSRTGDSQVRRTYREHEHRERGNCEKEGVVVTGLANRAGFERAEGARVRR